jgi:hypothetical protein
MNGETMKYSRKRATIVGTIALFAASVLPVTVLAAPAEAATSNLTFYYSRAEVEQMYSTLQNIGTACRVVPLPYYAAVACAAPPALADAVSAAHYRKERIKAVFHDCGYDWCDSYTYTVIK